MFLNWNTLQQMLKYNYHKVDSEENEIKLLQWSLLLSKFHNVTQEWKKKSKSDTGKISKERWRLRKPGARPQRSCSVQIWEELANQVWFGKAISDTFCKEATKSKLITPAVASEKLRFLLGLQELIRLVLKSQPQVIYTGDTKGIWTRPIKYMFEQTMY